MLDNPETAQYTHTLTVIGKHSGLYMCAVANDKPSHDSGGICIIGKTVIEVLTANLTIICYIYVQGAPVMFEAEVGRREVVFSWFPPSQDNGVVNYTLSCSPSPSSLPKTHPQSGPLTVTGFLPETPYSCSLVATHTCASGTPANTTFTTLQDCNFNA